MSRKCSIYTGTFHVYGKFSNYTEIFYFFIENSKYRQHLPNTENRGLLITSMFHSSKEYAIHKQNTRLKQSIIRILFAELSYIIPKSKNPELEIGLPCCLILKQSTRIDSNKGDLVPWTSPQGLCIAG